jgi:hypothetical protein
MAVSSLIDLLRVSMALGYFDDNKHARDVTLYRPRLSPASNGTSHFKATTPHSARIRD